MNKPRLRFSEFSDQWQKANLGNIANFLPGYAFDGSRFGDIGRKLAIPKNFTKLGYGNFSTEYSKFSSEECAEKYICKGGDLLVLMTDLSQNCELLGKPLLLKNEDGEVLLNQRIVKIEPSKELVTSFLLNIFLTIDYHKKIKELATGSTVKHLSSGGIKNISIAFPSFEEQTKIANFLTAVDAKISQLTKKHELLTLYKKGVMQKIFSRELRFKDDDGREFGEWKEMKFGDLGTIVTGKTPSTSDESLWNGDILFITPTDIGEEKYQISSARTVVKKEKMNVLPTHSIMFTCIASIGKMALSIKPCITNQQINSLIPSNSHYGEFIYYAILNMVDFIKSTQSTTTLPIINKTDFSKFLVEIPSYKEQVKIANFLTAIDDKITNIKSQLGATKEYKQGLLQQMFV